MSNFILPRRTPRRNGPTITSIIAWLLPNRAAEAERTRRQKLIDKITERNTQLAAELHRQYGGGR